MDWLQRIGKRSSQTGARIGFEATDKVYGSWRKDLAEGAGMIGPLTSGMFWLGLGRYREGWGRLGRWETWMYCSERRGGSLVLRVCKE